MSSKALPARNVEKVHKPVTTTQAQSGAVFSHGASRLPLMFIFTAGLDGIVTGCDRGVSHQGFAATNLIGESISALCDSGHSKPADGLVLPSVLEKGEFEGELRYRATDRTNDRAKDRAKDLAKTGRGVEGRVSLRLLRDLNGNPTGIVGLLFESGTDVASDTSLKAESSAPHSSGATSAVPLARRIIDGTEFLIASPLMHKFLGMVDRVAGHTETVLVTGETGTGKELVARTIHESSYRHKHALIDINCAALPEHLVESELFGYEKGAFSGADASKPGLFELADKSTIFLDEIGELQPQVQVKLLRVLDGAPYYRLGGNRKITVDVRVVAATNQDLESAVKEGRFRKDLFHRLSQFQLRVPPLRERPEDIAALARHFLALKAADKVFTADALSVLLAHSWPGNIRELRNLVAKLAMAAEDQQITGSQVAAELSGETTATNRDRRRAVPLGNLENMEEQMIIRALEQTGGHRARAAEQLGISRRTLSRKLREYEIDVRPGETAARLGTISEEQQKFFRAKVNLSVTIRNARGKELQVQAVNLSTGGLGLDALSDPSGFSGLVDVSFLLPDSETEIHAKGRLVWADAGGRAGLRFVVVEPALFEKLQQWTNRKMKDEGWETPS
jgi:DNA-binding NtrC family response regulator